VDNILDCMIFTAEEINRLLEIVDYHSSFVVGEVLGREALSDYDRFILNKYGIDPDKISEGRETSYYEMFMWGRLSSLLSDKQNKDLSYNDYEKYIKRGQYIPLTKVEQGQFDLAKQRTYGHLKGLGEKIKRDVGGIAVYQDLKKREEYEKIIHDEIERGVLERKTISGIISEIGHKTEDWYRDWGRIVETEFNNIFQEGRAEDILTRKGADVKVFKDVYPKACRHCIKAYLTDGLDSQPKLFKISELMANGVDNVGRHVEDWKPVIGSMHPWCRCTLRELPLGYVWNEETKSFEMGKGEGYKSKYHRPKVKMTIGDKEMWV
jgi:hypothetical protein